jgi:hydroxymethylglutaryl-CoA lyase
MPSLPANVTIVEVAPRDGLQNEASTLPTALKIEFIKKLAATGLKTIEATSFVSAKWVPQLADATEVLEAVNTIKNINFPVLVPNETGMETALRAGAKSIAVFTAASNTFSQKNTNCTIEQSMQRIEKIVAIAKQHEIKVRGYISCALGCPYEGEIAPSKSAEIASQLFALGCYEIALGDTIGVGTPLRAQKLIEAVGNVIPITAIAAHFHDTYGQALANIYAVMQQGVRVFDASVAGLGGCPYAKGASGNVATEDLLYMLEGMGIDTGVDLDRLLEVSKFICAALNKKPASKVAIARLDSVIPGKA